MRLSVTSMRTRRMRGAPSERRTAISRRRQAARGGSRGAPGAQAMSNTDRGGRWVHAQAEEREAGRAEREADGVLAAARGGAGEQQGGHVGAGDQQYQGERAEEKEEQEQIADGRVDLEFTVPGAIGSGDRGGASGMVQILLALQDVELGLHLAARESRPIGRAA